MKKGLNISSKNIGLLLVIVIIVSIVGGVLLYLNSPKMKFINLVNNEYKSFASLIDNISNSELATLSKNNSVVSNGNMDFNITLDNTLFGDSMGNTIASINGLKLNYEYGSDPKNSKTYLKLNSNIDDKDFVDMNLYQTNNKKYVYFKNIYDKYIESNNLSFIDSKTNKADDMLYLTNKIKQSIFLAVKASDFTVENKTITVNRENISTQKISFKLTDKRLKEIAKAVLTDLKNDDKAVSIMNNFNSDQNAKDTLSKAISSLNNKKLLTADLTIDVYAKNNKVVELDMFSGKMMKMKYLSYIGFNPTKEIILFNDNQSTLLDAKFNEESKDTIAYELEIINNQFNIQGTISKIVTNSGKKWNTDINLNLSLTYNSSLLGTLKINSSTLTKIGDKVEIPNSFNSIKEEDLTESDQEKITNSIFTKLHDLFQFNLSPDLTSPDEGEIY